MYFSNPSYISMSSERDVLKLELLDEEYIESNGDTVGMIVGEYFWEH